jgi:hypothetical protein
MKGSHVFSALAAVFAISAGCSGEVSSNNEVQPCRAWCDKACAALHACHDWVDSDTCPSSCQTELGATPCTRLRSPDQLSCSELDHAFECINYCSRFCEKVSDCGAFDSTLCAEGCAAREPLVCNARSVWDRNCEQLSPEARLYEDTARALREGTDIGPGPSSPGEFGCA